MPPLQNWVAIISNYFSLDISNKLSWLKRLLETSSISRKDVQIHTEREASDKGVKNSVWLTFLVQAIGIKGLKMIQCDGFPRVFCYSSSQSGLFSNVHDSWAHHNFVLFKSQKK